MGNQVCTCVISSEDLKPNHKNKELEDQLSSKLVTKDDFQINATLGRGGFGKVSLVTKKSNSKIFAMKSIKKSLIDKKNQQQHIKFERTILEVAKCPFVVNLRYAFQTADKLYMVMDFCQGGELFYHLRKAGTFSESKAKFYIAEISLALNYLHKKGIIYRDLKPENILLDKDGHIKITDFGLSKLGIKESDRTFTQCGTPEYLSPEIINGLGHDKAVDYWSLGALFYEMLTGDPPFYNQNKSKMFNDIVNKPVEIKSYFSLEAADLIKQLLTVNPKQRLQDIQAIKEHQFFISFDWQQLESKKLKPPFIPKIISQYDVSNFHDDFTEEKAYDSSVQDNQWNVSKKLNNQYNGFTYVDESLKLNKLQSMEKGQIGSQTSQNNFAFASPKFQSIEKNQFFQQDSGSQNYIKMNGIVFPKVNSSQTEKNQTQLAKQQQPIIQGNGFDTAVQKIKAKSKKIIETKKLLAVAQ